MTGFNVEWAVEELSKFIELTDLSERFNYRGNANEITAQAQIVEIILDRITLKWRFVIPWDNCDEWAQLRESALRAREQLLRQDEIRKNLGDDAPELSAAKLHPWVWDGASSLWQSGHFREAVEGAIRKLNAETQNKLGRRDVSEADLFNQAFSEQPPAVKNPRLHRMPDDDSKTFKSVQRGARMFAEGVFAGIRNPLAHEADREMPEQQALEYLAALSVLARWVDESTLEVAS